MPRAVEGRGVADHPFLPLFALLRYPARLSPLEFPKEKVAGKAETNAPWGTNGPAMSAEDTDGVSWVFFYSHERG